MSDTATYTIYSTPTCGFCHMLKEYLKGKNVPFRDIDITTDADGLKWVIENTGQAAVPVSRIGNDVIIGFDRPRVDLALREHKLI